MDALCDPRAFLSAQEKRAEQLKALGIEETDISKDVIQSKGNTGAGQLLEIVKDRLGATRKVLTKKSLTRKILRRKALMGKVLTRKPSMGKAIVLENPKTTRYINLT